MKEETEETNEIKELRKLSREVRRLRESEKVSSEPETLIVGDVQLGSRNLNLQQLGSYIKTLINDKTISNYLKTFKIKKNLPQSYAG